MAETVYVLFNAAMPTLSRVGVLEDGGSPSDLMVKIYNENIPLPYECVYACTVKDGIQAERAVYEKFAAQHIGRYGGFMDVDPESMVEILRPYESEDVTESFRASFDSTLEDDEKEAREHYKKMKKVKRPPFDFEISDEFAKLINGLVDAIEDGDVVAQALLEQEIWAARRELPEGSAEEDWILSYYYERGWKREQ